MYFKLDPVARRCVFCVFHISDYPTQWVFDVKCKGRRASGLQSLVVDASAQNQVSAHVYRAECGLQGSIVEVPWNDLRFLQRALFGLSASCIGVAVTPHAIASSLCLRAKPTAVVSMGSQLFVVGLAQPAYSRIGFPESCFLALAAAGLQAR